MLHVSRYLEEYELHVDDKEEGAYPFEENPSESNNRVLRDDITENIGPNISIDHEAFFHNPYCNPSNQHSRPSDPPDKRWKEYLVRHVGE